MTRWYDELYDDNDDALRRGLDLLEELRGALPPEKQHAVDEAKALLCRAARLYKDAQKRLEQQQKEGAPPL
ncbi:MAG: hypothetical protein ACI4XW_08665 [Candidatus Spyradocola sp.]